MMIDERRLNQFSIPHSSFSITPRGSALRAAIRRGAKVVAAYNAPTRRYSACDLGVWINQPRDEGDGGNKRQHDHKRDPTSVINSQTADDCQSAAADGSHLSAGPPSTFVDSQ